MAAEGQAGQEEEQGRQQDKEGDEVRDKEGDKVRDKVGDEVRDKEEDEVPPRMLWESIINTIMEQKVSRVNGKDWAEKDPCCHVDDSASGEEDLDNNIISFCNKDQRLDHLIIYCCVYFLNAYEENDSAVRQQLLKKGRFILKTLVSKNRELPYEAFRSDLKVIESITNQKPKVYNDFEGASLIHIVVFYNDLETLKVFLEAHRQANAGEGKKKVDHMDKNLDCSCKYLQPPFIFPSDSSDKSDNNSGCCCTGCCHCCCSCYCRPCSFSSLSSQENKRSYFYKGKQFFHYWGTTPLMIAVAKGNLKICSMLAERIYESQGVFETDQYDNNPFHMAALHGRMEIFEWLCLFIRHHSRKEKTSAEHDSCQYHDANKDMEMLEQYMLKKNKFGFTPLTLAVRVGNLEMFQYIRQRCFQYDSWKYSNKQHVYLSLSQIDTFRIHSDESNHMLAELHKGHWRSAIEIYVNHELQSLCADELMQELIEDKWKSHICWFFVMFSLVPAFLFYMLLIANVFVRCIELDFWNGKTYSSSSPPPFTKGFSAGSSRMEKVSVALEVFTLFCNLLFLYASFKCCRWKQHDWDPSSFNSVLGWGKKSHHHYTKRLIQFILKNLNSILGFIIGLCVKSAFACRLAGSMMFELNLNAISLVLYSYYLFVLCLPFKQLGILSILLFKVLMQSVFLWAVVYIIVLLAFSSAMHTTYKDAKIAQPIPDTNFTFQNNFGINVASLLWVSFGEVDNRGFIYASENSQIAMILNIVWAVFSCILVLNFLIAIVSRFFDLKQQDAVLTWSIFFAYTVIRYERIYNKFAKKHLPFFPEKRTGQKYPQTSKKKMASFRSAGAGSLGKGRGKSLVGGGGGGGGGGGARAGDGGGDGTGAGTGTGLTEMNQKIFEADICRSEDFFWEFVSDWHTGLSILFESMVRVSSSDLLPFSASAKHHYLDKMEDTINKIFESCDTRTRDGLEKLAKTLLVKCSQPGEPNRHSHQTPLDLEACEMSVGEHMISYEALKAAAVKLEEKQVYPQSPDPEVGDGGPVEAEGGRLDYQLFTDVLICFAHFLEVTTACILRSANNVAKTDGVKQVSKPHVELGITLFEEMFKSEQERTLTLVESMLVGQGKVKRPEASLCVTSGIRAEGAGRSHRKEEGLREDGGPAMIDAPSSVGHAPAPSLQGSTESSSAGQPDKRQGAAAGQLSIDARTIVGSAIAKTGRMLKLQPIDKKHEKYRAPDVKKPI